MSAEGRLDGRRVVVTGAARGLGRAVATRLVGEGAAAMLADVDAGGLDKTVRSLTGPVLSLVADCATTEGITRVLDDATAAWGSPPDALVNNAGVLANGLLLDLADADIDRVLRINAMGPMLATREFARRLVAVGGTGAVVNITSTTAHVACLPGLSAYAASKGALLAFTRSAAADLAEHGIRVNAVTPGWMRTAMTKGLGGQERSPLLHRIPMGRPADPAEVAAAVCWLLSDDAGYVTGTSLAVDGGWLGY